MQLFFKGRCLGEVTDTFGDQPEMHGTLAPSPEFGDFLDFFRWMVNEDNFSREPPFEAALLDEGNWFMADAEGNRHGISIPAVHPDGEVVWRWRGTSWLR